MEVCLASSASSNRGHAGDVLPANSVMRNQKKKKKNVVQKITRSMGKDEIMGIINHGGKVTLGKCDKDDFVNFVLCKCN